MFVALVRIRLNGNLANNLCRPTGPLCCRTDLNIGRRDLLQLAGPGGAATVGQHLLLVAGLDLRQGGRLGAAQQGQALVYWLHLCTGELRKHEERSQ